jgi:hypothetical protein
MLYVDDPKNAAESSSPALQLIDGYTPEYHLNTDISAFDFFFQKNHRYCYASNLKKTKLPIV